MPSCGRGDTEADASAEADSDRTIAEDHLSLGHEASELRAHRQVAGFASGHAFLSPASDQSREAVRYFAYRAARPVARDDGRQRAKSQTR